MNKSIVRRALPCAFITLLLAGCFPASPQVAYYSLYVPPPKSAAPTSAATRVLAVSVGPVVIPDILKQAQIATGGADGRYHLSPYHRWSGEVNRDLARALAEQLAVNLGTEQVAIFPWDQNFRPDWRLLVDVLNMGGEPGQEATLAVRWSLVDPQGKTPQIIRRSDFREQPAVAGYPAWVAAQQRNVAKLGQEISGAIRPR